MNKINSALVGIQHVHNVQPYFFISKFTCVKIYLTFTSPPSSSEQLTTKVFFRRLTRQASLPSVCANGPRSAPPPIDQQQQTGNSTTGNSPTQKRSVMSRSPSSAKELLLMWAQQRTNSYSVNR